MTAPRSASADPHVRPRRLGHRGVVDASAFLVERRWTGEVRAKERVVRLASDADVYAVAGGWIVRKRTPVSTPCAAAPGIPFVAVRGQPRVLSSAPLDEDEVRALSPRRGEDVFVLVSGGTARLLEPEAAVDPADWIDLDGHEIADVEPLGPLPPEPLPVLAAGRTVREALGAARPSDELGALVQALRASATSRRPAPPGGAARGTERGSARPDASGASGGFLAGVMTGLALALSAFASLFAGGGAASAGRAPAPEPAGADATSLAPLAQEPAGPSWLAQLRSRLLELVARALVATRLAAVLGKKHAEYLQRMLDLFEAGDLDEALRWAIPLGEDDAGGDRADPAFLPPTPRSALAINLGARMVRGRALGVGETLFDHLKQRYRAAFEKLSAAGRHEDAAFVLVELLGATEEAVSYLERHRLFRLAAEIAEARKLPPAMVVRQWMLAGDVARAVAIARIHGVFADAIVRLEANDRDAARALRLLWADTLAAAGAYAAAVDAVWPVEDGRRLALRWLDHAIDVGGVVGARMLARKSSLEGAPFEEVRDAALAILDDASPEGHLAATAFGHALASGPATPATRILARRAARALVRDPTVAWLVDRLVTMSGDPVLSSDLAAAPAVAVTAAAAPSKEPIVRGLADRGAIAATDAVLLPGGRILAALGEAGARIVAPDGRTLARFLEPAHAVVLSDHGDRALLLAPRGAGVWRIARLDVVGRRVRTWCDARFDAFATDFDGAVWMVGSGETLRAIDVLDEGWRRLWEVVEPGMIVRAIARDPKQITALREPPPGRGTQKGEPPSTLGRWTYDAAGFVLRSRSTFDLAALHVRQYGAPAPDGSLAAVREDPGGRAAIEVTSGTSASWRRVIASAAGPIRALGVDADGLVSFTEASGAGISLSLARGGERALEIVLAGAARARARRSGDRVLASDDRGRILLASIETRRVLHEWRLA